jgi:ParB family chromosome partitioning protein
LPRSRGATFVDVYGTTDVKVSYYLTDPKAAGFHRYGQTAKEPMTEEQKAERKTLIANNKAWDWAETVRREWLGEFLTRKTLPKDAPQFIARGLTLHHSIVGTG